MKRAALILSYIFLIPSTYASVESFDQDYTSKSSLKSFFEYVEATLKDEHPDLEPSHVAIALDWDHTIGKNQKGLKDVLLESAQDAPSLVEKKIGEGYKVTIVTSRCALLEDERYSKKERHEGYRLSINSIAETGVDASGSFEKVKHSLKLEACRKGYLIPRYKKGVLVAGSFKYSVYQAFLKAMGYKPKLVFVFDDYLNLWRGHVPEEGSPKYYFVLKDNKG